MKYSQVPQQKYKTLDSRVLYHQHVIVQVHSALKYYFPWAVYGAAHKDKYKKMQIQKRLFDLYHRHEPLSGLVSWG